ncbi:hypothetical protein Tco_1230888 [Tanacetum coccineum]
MGGNFGYGDSREQALKTWVWGAETPRVSSSGGPNTQQPTLTTWIDLEDGRTYIDVPAYPPPAPPIQTLPSPEWSSGLLPFSLAPSIFPLPVSSPMISLTIPSPIASPATAVAEGFLTELGAQMADMSRAGYDDHRLVHDLIVQQATLQRELQEMRGRVTALEEERDHREQ